MMKQQRTLKHSVQARLFVNPALEIFTRTNLFIHIVTYTGVACFFLFFPFFKTSLPAYLLLISIAGGFLFWTLFEYIMHRFLFHIASENRFVRRILHVLHGIHHAHPDDEERIFMPPLPGIIIIMTLSGIFYLPIGNFVSSFLAGMTIGCLSSLMHYGMHKLRSPPVHETTVAASRFTSL